MCAKAKISIKAKSRLNYADSCAGQSVISNVTVENVGDTTLSNVRLVVRSENGELAQTSFDFDKIKPKEKVSRAAACVRPSALVMQKVTEEYTSTIHAELFDGADLIGSASCEIDIDPVDMWAGFAATLALAGFCIPNHPALAPLCKRTSELMKERHGSGSLSGYKNANPAWASHMVKAAYDAVNELNLTYALPPASFLSGQRIRLAHRVLAEGKGTCIDLAFKFASLLEALGLYPIIVMYGNHAHAGVWLKKPAASVKRNVFNKNKADLIALTEGPDPSIALIECTMLTHAGAGSYKDAEKSGRDQVKTKDNFEYWLDIQEARFRGGLPMPLFAMEDEGEANAGDGELPFGPQPDFDEGEGGEGAAKPANGAEGSGEDADAGEDGGLDAGEGEDLDAGENEGADASGGEGEGGHDRPASRKPRRLKDEVIEDLRAHAGELGYNPVTRALLGEALPNAHKGVDEPAFVDPTGMVAPLPSDASQLHAVQYVSAGGSCVIDGSPGTGKTQVIVNATTDAMARGKRVLVVLQNDEQLGVMAKRLQAAAAGPFVLRLGKNPKPAGMLEQIEDACALDAAGIDALLLECGYSSDADAVDVQRSVELSRELDAYGAALQRENAAGISLREQIEGYQRHRHAPDLVSLGSEAVGVLGSRRDLDESLRLIDDMAAHAAGMGDLRNHPLERFGDSLKDKTVYELRSYAEKRLDELGKLREELVSMDEAAALAVLEDAGTFAGGTWADSAVGDTVSDLVEGHLAAVCAARSFAQQMESVWKPSFFELEVQDLAVRWRAANEAPFVRRRLAKREVCAFVEEHSWKPLADADVENALGALAFYESQMDEARIGFMAEKDRIDELLAAEEKALTRLAEIDDELHDWNVWADYAERADERGLGKMTAALRAGGEGALVAEAAKKALFHAMCADSIRGDETVRRFSGPVFERAIERFSAIDDAWHARAARSLVEACARRAKDVLADEDLANQVESYKVALQARGRGFDAAALLRAFPEVALGACPCVLATPASIARHLDWGIKFDMVVIDEASQLETARALGLLERAAQAVVVGDPQQLPPTSFFTKKHDISDLGMEPKGESILDECLILGLPRITLRWHYRSRHESLIAFSNEQFYRGRLLTFPSADDRASKVQLRRVNGVYEKGGTNPAEAEAIVAEIKRRYEADLAASDQDAGCGIDPISRGEDEHADKGCGIGVITFNVKQQALVQKLLKDEFARDAAFAEWAQRGSECLFVRNLENVQGDERDVIMLSMTYARDAQGKLSLNFGPVNKAGGERRLNVAFTRARCEMLVFAALSSGDIVVDAATAKSVCVVRDYLAYAEGLRSISPTSAAAGVASDQSDAIAERLCKALEERGYLTQRGVGASRVKVDIAVVDPQDGRRYLAGILLDGQSYRVARSTRDRELGKLEQLRDLGWNVHRVWAVDYLFDERKCVDRVVAFLGGLAA